MHAVVGIGRGTEVTVPESGPFLGGAHGDPPFTVSFDGGARIVDGQPVAGACAVLWTCTVRSGASDDSGWSRCAVATAALPLERSPGVAEAWGLRLALTLLGRVGDGERRARVVGDNLAVIRYGAAQGRLHNPSMEALVAPLLGRLALGGWALDFAAVRRRFNSVADGGATEALMAARRRLDDGRVAPYVECRWARDGEPPLA